MRNDRWIVYTPETFNRQMEFLVYHTPIRLYWVKDINEASQITKKQLKAFKRRHPKIFYGIDLHPRSRYE